MEQDITAMFDRCMNCCMNVDGKKALRYAKSSTISLS